MALTTLFAGTNAPEAYAGGAASYTEKSINTYEGDDTVVLSADYIKGFIGLDGDNDILIVGDLAVPPAQFLVNTVRGGQGEDNIGIFASTVSFNEIWLDEGNDRLLLGSNPVTGVPTFANYTRNTFLGGEGTDAIIVDNTVNRFNQNLVDLGENDNSTLGNLADLLVDGLLAGEAFNDLINQGPVVEYAYVAATEIDQTTIRGGSGEDVLFLEAFTGSPSTLDGNDLPVTRSLINGNAGDDFVGVARDLGAGTSILGGQGNDQVLLLSGTFLGSSINGNAGADLITVGAIDSNRSTVRGGQGDDVFNVGSAVATASLLAGDLGNDKINFAALTSQNVTLSGGAGNDEIDDFSYAITGQGNVLEGGEGRDTLRQAANIFAAASNGATNGIFDFAATFIGGKGADRLTGEYRTQLVAPKELNAAGTDVIGASSDTFQFSFGDSVINSSGVGADIITDFDSNASRYKLNGVGGFNVPLNPVTDFALPTTANALAEARERDVIDLTDANISIGTPTNLNEFPFAGESITTRGQVKGVGNIQRFLSIASSVTTAGGALIWDQAGGVLPAPRSQLFISDGIAGLTDGDLLIQLDQVSGLTSANAGIVISAGNITDIRL